MLAGLQGADACRAHVRRAVVGAEGAHAHMRRAVGGAEGTVCLGACRLRVCVLGGEGGTQEAQQSATPSPPLAVAAGLVVTAGAATAT